MMALRQGWRGAARAGLLVLASCLAALLLFDVLAYFLMPASLTTFAPAYRQPPPSLLEDMRGYSRADPVLGFDIAPDQPGHHRRHITGHGYFPASSNDLGCRDPRSLADIQQLGEYTYFAGDSFTWGWGHEAQAFPRVYERASGNPSLNCGVGGSGQFHQLEKFRSTVRAIGHLPRLVVVGLFTNDMVDDLWHPHISVVRGHRVNLYRPVHRPGAKGRTLAGKESGAQEYIPWFWRASDVEREVRAWELQNQPPSPLKRFQLWQEEAQKRYSLLHNIHLQRRGRQPSKRDELPTDPLDPRAHMIALMHHYRQNPYTRPHREALRAWAEHARGHGYRLAAVLIPGRRFLANERVREMSRDWRAEVRAHLADLDVPLLDFFGHALAQGLRAEDLHYLYDGHMNEHGNRILGEWLAEQLPRAVPPPQAPP